MEEKGAEVVDGAVEVVEDAVEIDPRATESVDGTTGVVSPAAEVVDGVAEAVEGALEVDTRPLAVVARASYALERQRHPRNSRRNIMHPGRGVGIARLFRDPCRGR